MEENNKIDKFKKESREIKKQVKDQVLGFIVAALGLVAGLAWNEAIKALIDSLFPLSKNSVWAKFIYAIFITIAVVIMTVYLMRLLGRKEDKK